MRKEIFDVQTVECAVWSVKLRLECKDRSVM